MEPLLEAKHYLLGPVRQEEVHLQQNSAPLIQKDTMVDSMKHS